METHYHVIETHNPLMETHNHLWKPFFFAKVGFHKWLVGVWFINKVQNGENIF
jgi:hypothetical protein